MRLVNLSTRDTRTVICLAGAFGEHEFGAVRHEAGDLEHPPAELDIL